MHQMLFCWERGDKLQSTEPQPVNHATGMVAWDETLRQVGLGLHASAFTASAHGSA